MRPHDLTLLLTFSLAGLEYYWLAAADIVNILIFNALSIGEGLVAAVLLCMKRGDFEFITNQTVFGVLSLNP